MLSEVGAISRTEVHAEFADSSADTSDVAHVPSGQSLEVDPDSRLCAFVA